MSVTESMSTARLAEVFCVQAPVCLCRPGRGCFDGVAFCGPQRTAEIASEMLAERGIEFPAGMGIALAHARTEGRGEFDALMADWPPRAIAVTGPRDGDPGTEQQAGGPCEAVGIAPGVQVGTGAPADVDLTACIDEAAGRMIAELEKKGVTVRLPISVSVVIERPVYRVFEFSFNFGPVVEKPDPTDLPAGVINSILDDALTDPFLDDDPLVTLTGDGSPGIPNVLIARKSTLDALAAMDLPANTIGEGLLVITDEPLPLDEDPTS